MIAGAHDETRQYLHWVSALGTKDASRVLRRAAESGAEELIDRFFEETGWHPAHVKPVAGALAYTRYRAMVRFGMKLCAKLAHLPTETSRDHELTDWIALDRFVDEIIATIPGATSL